MKRRDVVLISAVVSVLVCTGKDYAAPRIAQALSLQPEACEWRVVCPQPAGSGIKAP